MMMMMMMMMRLLDGGQMPKADPAMKTSQYVRDRSQNHLLGIFDEELQQVREEEDEDQAAHGIFRERKKKSKRNNPTLAFEKKKKQKTKTWPAPLWRTKCWPSAPTARRATRPARPTWRSPVSHRAAVSFLFCFVLFFLFFFCILGQRKKIQNQVVCPSLKLKSNPSESLPTMGPHRSLSIDIHRESIRKSVCVCVCVCVEIDGIRFLFLAPPPGPAPGPAPRHSVLQGVHHHGDVVRRLRRADQRSQVGLGHRREGRAHLAAPHRRRRPVARRPQVGDVLLRHPRIGIWGPFLLLLLLLLLVVALIGNQTTSKKVFFNNKQTSSIVIVGGFSLDVTGFFFKFNCVFVGFCKNFSSFYRFYCFF